jgi:hypothetical protein
MIMPRKQVLRINSRADDKDKVAELVAHVLFLDDRVEEIKLDLENKGSYDAGEYYDDIACSKIFKIMQEANAQKLFTMSAVAVEEVG